MPGVPLVRVVRSGLEESVHTGSVAAADASGRLIASAGDPGTVVFARSAMKPLQAAVSFDAAGGFLGVGDDEVAVAAGSHDGEPEHLAAVERLLERAGLGEGALRCPPSLPLGAEAALRVTERRRLYHNCSGKHAAMLLASVRARDGPSRYTEDDHPLQRSVLDAVRDAAGDPVAIGVDGCGVPVHALRLEALATLYARLCRPESLGRIGGAVAAVTGAMRRRPRLVEGRGKTATALMEAAGGLVAKGGAEGLACAASPDRGIGVAVKVADGGSRAAAPALVRALRLLGLLDDRAVASLADVAAPPVFGGERFVGSLRSDFELRGA